MRPMVISPPLLTNKIPNSASALLNISILLLTPIGPVSSTEDITPTYLPKMNPFKSAEDDDVYFSDDTEDEDPDRLPPSEGQ